MNLSRSAGVLLHVTSLSGGQGIGDMGPEAYRFIDWLVQAGQRIWQILPLGPTGYGDSPYASSSAFAGNPSLISLELLVQDGLLTKDEIESSLSPSSVEFDAVSKFKHAALQRTFERFRPTDEFDAFCAAASYWLDDFLRIRQQSGCDVRLDRFVQYVFHEQWLALKRYANERNIQIVGDIPIFVAEGSVDVLAHPEYFNLDDKARPKVVAGVPPDLFSSTGQRWGNPLYRWEFMAADGYRWWRDRLRRAFELVDVIRIDHFRGIAAYWEVPAIQKTAVQGTWKRGPGADLFRALVADLGPLQVIVEDLGLITPDVTALREELGYPGMKVLQFAFGDGPDNPYLPHNFISNCVVYTGTHDNQTTRGWFESQDERVKHHVREYLGCDGADIAWDFIRLAFQSVAVLAVVPAQDILSLGDEARLNFPGKAVGNWGWRLTSGALDDDAAARLRELTDLTRRLDTPPPPPPTLPSRYPL